MSFTRLVIVRAANGSKCIHPNIPTTGWARGTLRVADFVLENGGWVSRCWFLKKCYFDSGSLCR